MIWYFGQTALFLFLFARVALAYLPTALSVALRPFFAFRQAQYVQVFLLMPAILHALCWSWQHQQVCHFSSIIRLSLCPRHPVVSSIFPFTSICLWQIWQIWQDLSFLFSSFIRLQWVFGQSFLRRNNAADELARQGALLEPSAIPCSVSPLISHIHFCLFSDWRRTVSSKFGFPQFPLRNLCSLVMLAVFSFVYVAMDTAFC